MSVAVANMDVSWMPHCWQMRAMAAVSIRKSDFQSIQYWCRKSGGDSMYSPWSNKTTCGRLGCIGCGLITMLPGCGSPTSIRPPWTRTSAQKCQQTNDIHTNKMDGTDNG